jgi:UDPglucose 6-dehydrogenase
MSPTEAEITKLASNTHDTMRVAFANMLLAACNEVPETNVDRVTQALAHRVGHRFFKGAIPYGGPCWPRDNRAMSAFLDLLGVPSDLPGAVDQANKDHAHYVLNEVLDAAPNGARVGILGLAYKLGTPLIDNAFGVDLAARLAAEGRKVVCWDPLALREASAVLEDKVEFAKSPQECLARDAVVITLPLPQLADLDWSAARHATVVDCWRSLNAHQQSFARKYVPLGAREGSGVESFTDNDARARFSDITS